jgi:hypothetical protein
MASNLVWKEERTFRGWGCDECDFIVMKPHRGDFLAEYVLDALDAFHKHECPFSTKRMAARETLS